MDHTTLYLISEETYHQSIADKVEIYNLIEQLYHKAKDIKTLDDIQVLIHTVCLHSGMAAAMLERWGIPDAYLLTGDPEDLEDLKKFEVVEYVLEDEVATQMEIDDDFENLVEDNKEEEEDCSNLWNFIKAEGSEKTPLYKLISIAEESSQIISENIHALAPENSHIKRILLRQSGSKDLYESINAFFRMMGVKTLPEYPNMGEEEISQAVFFWYLQNALTKALK